MGKSVIINTNHLHKIVNAIYPSFQGMDESFKKDRESFVSYCHSMLSGGIAMTIRNLYNLWDSDSEHYKRLNEETGATCADEMSSLITGGVWDKFYSKDNSFRIVEGEEAGDICNREGCTGIIEERELEGGCSCHIMPPCSYCETAKEVCPECEWDAEEEQYENYLAYQASITDEQKERWAEEARLRNEANTRWWNKYHGVEPVDEITVRSNSHTHFSMEKFGMFPIGTDIETVRAVVKGSFGGRFKKFNKDTGRFHYIAYTD